MAIVRLIPRRFLITIGNLDHSNCIEVYDGGDEKLTYDGLVMFRGKMSIRRAMGTETLDDRKNKRWNRGTPIDIKLTDDFGVMRPCPRGAKLFILSSVYNLQTRQLDIECGDSFALLKQREPDGNASGVCLGAGESKTSVINRLLAAAGAPALIDAVPGTIDIPAAKNSGGSYIDQAGRIAAGSGYFLFVDSLNQVRAKPIAIELGTPKFTISILDEGSKSKRITGESPAAWFVVNSNNQSATSSKYGYELTDEAYGPISIAGVAAEGMVIIRREWQKESLSGHKRFVETIVREPIGAVVPLLKGDASSIVSIEKLEIFEYENAAFSIGSNGSDACQSGNQGRLIKRTLTVKQPIGKVLSKIIDAAPEEVRPPSLSNLILAIKEEEEFDYNRTVIATSSTTLPQTGPIDPNQVPPSDPASEAPKKMSGIKHILKRWEPAGAISPEDYEYDLDQQMWIVVAQDLKQSYQLTKEWTEGRSDEWTFTEREQISFNRYQPEAAAESRARMKERPGTYYKDIFCALMLSRSPRKASSSGNTQPPAPDTMPSTHGIKNDTKSYKYKMPFDTDFPFRQKKVEISVEHLSIDGNLLAEKWGKVLWGRFKGLTIESEFSQYWWDYEPMCRINILEPNITLAGDEIDTSAYLGEAFSIAIANGQCAIGIDGIFLGFVQNNILIPPYLEETFIEISASVETVWTTTGDLAVAPDPIVSLMVISATVETRWITTLNPITNLRLFSQTNTNRNAAFSASSGNAIFNTQTGFREAYELTATWSKPESDIYNGIDSGPPIARYDVQLRKNGGAWSTPIAVTGTAFRMESIGTALPGISYVNDIDQNKTYVGPGVYEVQVTAIGTGGGRSIVASGAITYPSTIDYLSITGMPSVINSGDVFTLTTQTSNNTITVAIGSPGYPAIVPVWAIESGPATITQDGEITILNHYLNGSTDPNHAPIFVSLTVDGYDGLKDYETIYALNPNGPVIESIDIIANTGTRSGNSLTIASDPEQFSLTAEVFGQGQFNDDVAWFVISGNATLSSSQTFDKHEAIYIHPSDNYLTIRATSQDSNIYTDISIEFQSQGQIAAVIIEAYNVDTEDESQPMTASIGHFIDLTATVTKSGNLVYPWDNVSWSVVGDSSFVDLQDWGNVCTIECLKSTVVGEQLTIKATSTIDSTKFALFDLTIKSKVTGVVIVPSVTTIGGSQSFTAQAYLTGQGGGTGASSIGSQQFAWSATGPGNIANSIASTATINTTATAGTIALSASFGSLSGSVNVTNTGDSTIDLSTLTLVSNYTITHTGDRSYTPFSYSTLNDGNEYTGMAIGKYYTGGGDCSIIIDLGSNLLVKAIELSGGYFDPTLPTKISPFASGGFDEVSPYLNGGYLEHSTNGTNWNTFIQIADITDYDYKNFYPNITARYWRIRRSLWCATSNFGVYV